MKKLFFIFCSLVLLYPVQLFSQLSKGGVPPSLEWGIWEGDFEKIAVFADEKRKALENKEMVEDKPIALQIGYTIDAGYDFGNSGTWTYLENGDRIWRLALHSAGARAMNVYFKNFYLPEGTELFLYNPGFTKIIGAFTADNNKEHGYFATELIRGDELIIEYYQPNSVREEAAFIIAEIGHIYHDMGTSSLKAFNQSQGCEVNVNCVEGELWQEQKKGVAKVIFKVGSYQWLCSGSLLNNVRRDFTPYFLTADHCAPNASPTDFLNTIFYFNYESTECENPPIEPKANTLTGAEFRANASQQTGSDFLLLQISQDIPAEFNPYFNGWNNQDQPALSGVTIHHPNGDIKKISTYTEPVVSSYYNSLPVNAELPYWRVLWAETENGHGVTEGGSSGAPLFNEKGLLTGTLSGGASSCDKLDQPDFYGKFSYSWQSNGSAASSQLKPWLDPDGIDVSGLDGMDYNSILFIAEFKTNLTVIPVGATLDFTDLSIGNPTEWKWVFEGAEPQSSAVQNPQGIIYNSLGTFAVELTVKRGPLSDMLLRKEYIKVVPRVAPVPVEDMLTIYLGAKPVEELKITLYDETGREVENFLFSNVVVSQDISLGKYRSGIYFVKVQTSDYVEVHKILIARK